MYDDADDDGDDDGDGDGDNDYEDGSQYGYRLSCREDPPKPPHIANHRSPALSVH